MSLSAHQSARSKSFDWLTPREILAPLGRFDLDPCCPRTMPWRTADAMIHFPDDGLKAKWGGRVWLNPPFGNQADAWLAKLADHGNGIALVAARTETKSFFRNVWGKAQAVCFLRGRPHFYAPNGKRAAFNSGAPICLIAYGWSNAFALWRSGLGRTVLA